MQIQTARRLRLILRLLCATFLITWGVTYYYKDKLPHQRFYRSVMPIHEPNQRPTDRQPWVISANQYRYLLAPKFAYELSGVVVTGTKAGQFGDIWHYRHWKDYINVRDLCVIWGENVKSGSYLSRRFSSDTWTCWISAQKNKAKATFSMRQLSNNHLLTDSDKIKRQLLQVETGDVIKLRGFLVDYKNLSNGYMRKTSTSRRDGGNGACETVYINEFTLVKKANPYLRAINLFAGYMTILMLVLLVIFTIISPLAI